MGIRVAYGSKSNMMGAIQNGVIPTDTLILTKDPRAIYFYDASKVLGAYTDGETVPEDCIHEYGTHLEFPNVGETGHLYIAADENGGAGYVYRYDAEDHKYYKPFDEVNEGPGTAFDVIYGGSAFDD